ncbi:MAG: hypothetical protein CSA22_09305 [Deltaproteobacteria bacterium]|nr:MAG: hypothetical protein CSA22_09305 [Deltaproteobacteria bacterium]
MTEKKKEDAAEQLKDVLGSLAKKYPKPDMAHPDYTGWDQTETEYQKQQRAWLDAVKKNVWKR